MGYVVEGLTVARDHPVPPKLRASPGLLTFPGSNEIDDKTKNTLPTANATHQILFKLILISLTVASRPDALKIGPLIGSL
jgi:hypothetical protein